jgi:hypothetical protein
MAKKNVDAATKFLNNAGFSKNGAKLESAKAKQAKAESKAQANAADGKKQAKPAADAKASKKQANAAEAADKKPSYLPLPDGTADALRITMLVQENPKRGASAERFALYKDGMTVAQALEAGVQRADLRWDLAHGWISIAAGAAGKASKKPAKKATAEA